MWNSAPSKRGVVTWSMEELRVDSNRKQNQDQASFGYYWVSLGIHGLSQPSLGIYMISSGHKSAMTATQTYG